MNKKQFKAYRVYENSDGTFTGKIEIRNENELPAGDLLIQVHYSSLNYKDALSAYGNKGVTRSYPHTPGIDSSGVVVSSSVSEYKPGDAVIVTSYDLGMNTDGGFGEYIRVPASWAIPLPEGLSLRDSMILGTAGLTAAQGTDQLIRNGITPGSGPVLVTGAHGSVGSLAVTLLAKLGYQVWAGVSETGQNEELLRQLGASEIVDREMTHDLSHKPLLRAQWAGAIDVIGGNTLSTIIRACKSDGVIVVVGNIESPDLSVNVFPFILRSVRLIGVATQDTPMEYRKRLWEKLGGEWHLNLPDELISEITMDEIGHYLSIQINKKSHGRIILKHETNQ